MESRGCSLAVVRRLLIVVTSLVAEHGLLGLWAAVVVAHRLSCSAACGIFLDQRLNSCPLHWQADSLPLSHQGSPICSLLILPQPCPTGLIVFVAACELSLVAVSRGYSVVAVDRLLIVVASLVAEHGP